MDSHQVSKYIEHIRRISLETKREHFIWSGFLIAIKIILKYFEEYYFATCYKDASYDCWANNFEFIWFISSIKPLESFQEFTVWESSFINTTSPRNTITIHFLKKGSGGSIVECWFKLSFFLLSLSGNSTLHLSWFALLTPGNYCWRLWC